MLSRISANWVGEASPRLAPSKESGAWSRTTALLRNSPRNSARKALKLSRCSTFHCQAAEVIRHSVVGQEQGFPEGRFALSFVPKRHLQDSDRIAPPTLIDAGYCVGLRL